MNNGIVIYKSKYGAAKKYAAWIAEELGFDCRDISGLKAEALQDYDKIVLCGGIYASGIACIPFLRKNYETIKDKRIAVFCTGASPYDEDAFDACRKHNMREPIQNVPVFYGRGAWDEASMSFADRTLCRMLQKAVAKKSPEEYEPWEAALMCAVGQSCDWTDKEYIKPLTEYMS